MKVIFFSFVLLINSNRVLNHCNLNKDRFDPKYSVTIWDSDYSMSYSNMYFIKNDSLSVTFIGGIQGEKNKIIFQKELTEGESRAFYKFLSLLSIDKLDEKYINVNILDGDQKRVRFQIDEKIKIVDISNFYQKDMDNLFRHVNQYVPENLMIRYIKPGKTEKRDR